MSRDVLSLFQTRLRRVLESGRCFSTTSAKFLAFAVAGNLKRIPMSLIMDEYAFSLAPNGWNYFRALVAEYEKEPGIPLNETSFFRFFQHPRIRSVRYLNDLLFLHQPDARRYQYNFYFGTYPWGDFWTRYSTVGGQPWGYHYDLTEGKTTRDLYGYRRNPWYRPGDTRPLEIEWNHTIALYHNLKKGYYPRRYGSLPEVVLLMRCNGDFRAVRCEGHHRLSILSQLGHVTVTVLIPPDSLRIIHEADVDKWYYVRNRLCTPEQALQIFHAFFELNGRERIESLGLPSVY